MISGNHFPPNLHVWLSGWPIFSPLTRKWFFTLIFTSNHFRKKREREREERAQIAPLVRRLPSSIERCDRRSRSMRSRGAIVDRAARSTSAIDERARQTRTARRTITPTSPPLDVAFTARSHLLLRRIWFIFFCCVLFLLPNLMHFLCKNVWMNQTPKLIFRKTNFVTAKHMKTFSFPENSISRKWNIFRKYFYANQTQPKMRILRWIRGNTKKDRIQNKEISLKIGPY